MSRKFLVAGNWKMNLNKAEGVALAKGLSAKAAEFGNVDVAVIPAFVHIDAVGSAIAGSPVGLGAQDVYFEKNGAFTGEVSTAMLKDLGVKYILVGHSERRHIIKECNCLLNKKLKAAIDNGFVAVLCIGETLEERETNKTFDVCKEQLEKGLKDVDVSKTNQIVIAYEPVWAIGTGKTASPDQAQEVHAYVRGVIAKIFNADVASKMVIQYGGSVKAANAAEILAKPDIDGALVGGAALKVDDFMGIIKGAASVKK